MNQDLHEVLERVRSALRDRYAVWETVGVGGSGVVFRAEDLKHGRHVAIKVLRGDVARALASERFLREIRTAARLQHPNIVPLYDSGEAEGLLYYVMPFVEGVTLRARLEEQGELEVGEAVKLAREVASALDYAHKLGIVHLDVKPENVLLYGGQAVVADFGISRAIDRSTKHFSLKPPTSDPEEEQDPGDAPAVEPGAPPGHPLRRAGFALGTPAYMSPEQTRDETLDARSDVYSLGCILYEMITGRPPFDGGTIWETASRHLSATPRPLREVRDGVPEAVERVTARALAKEPDRRFQSAREMVRGLDEMLEREREREMTRSRRMVLGSVAALVMVVMAAVGTALLGGPGGPDGVPRIAVLPFEHVGADEEAYLAAGLTDEITSRLASFSSLFVTSPVSTAQYLPRQWTLEEVGSELGVTHILTGTVRTERTRDGAGSIRVVPHLTRVSDRRELWSAPLDGRLEPGSMFAVQSEIADAVAAAMNITLRAPEGAQGVAQPTQDVRAYDLYLRGNSYTMFYGEEETRQAAEMYRAAVAIDPSFAVAWAKLAMAEAGYYLTFESTPERAAAAREAARRAVDLQPDLPEARFAHAYAFPFLEGDYAGAIEEMREIAEARPNDAELLWVMSQSQRRLGDSETAAETARRAVELNPRSATNVLNLANALIDVRRYEDARPFLEQAKALAPDWLPPYVMSSFLRRLQDGDIARSQEELRGAFRYVEPEALLGLYIARYRWELAFLDEELKRQFEALSLDDLRVDPGSFYLARAEVARWDGRFSAAEAYADSARLVLESRVGGGAKAPNLLMELAVAYAGLGRHEEAVAMGERASALLPLDRDPLLGAFLRTSLVQVYAMAGRPGDAVAVLDTLLSIPGPISAAYARVHPNLAPLRQDPAFQALVQGS